MATERDDERAGWLARLRAAYGPGGDLGERAALLARLLAALSPAAREQGRGRWRAWAYELPPAGTGAPSDRERFEALFAAWLAGTLDSGGADDAWLLSGLEAWEAAQTEAHELRQILADERADRAAGAAPPGAFPAYDLAFLAAPGGELPPPPGVIVPITVALETAFEAGQRVLRLVFGPAPPPPAPLPVAVAEEPEAYTPQPDPTPPAAIPGAPGPWLPLLAQALDLAPAHAPPALCTVRVQVQRLNGTTGRLHIHLSGPGVAGHAAGIAVQVEPPRRPPLAAATDADGAALLTVPWATLPHLTLRLILPA